MARPPLNFLTQPSSGQKAMVGSATPIDVSALPGSGLANPWFHLKVIEFMHIDSWMASFLSNEQAVLPAALALYAGLYAAWALVLVWGVSALSTRWGLRSRLGVMVAVAVMTLVPGRSSPAYWLGLAFQSPSLTTVLLAAYSLWRIARAMPTSRSAGWSRCELTVCGLGVGLGWLLLLDTLAWWPVSVYAWGFSPAAVAGLALAVALGWAIAGGAHKNQALGLVWGLPALVLALFVVTRWPSGNVWDALLDPWLWVGLQLVLLVSGLRAWRQRGAPATPA